jgi:hypothetical protein
LRTKLSNFLCHLWSTLEGLSTRTMIKGFSNL